MRPIFPTSAIVDCFVNIFVTLHGEHIPMISVDKERADSNSRIYRSSLDRGVYRINVKVKS